MSRINNHHTNLKLNNARVTDTSDLENSSPHQHRRAFTKTPVVSPPPIVTPEGNPVETIFLQKSKASTEECVSSYRELLRSQRLCNHPGSFIEMVQTTHSWCGTATAVLRAFRSQNKTMISATQGSRTWCYLGLADTNACFSSCARTAP